MSVTTTIRITAAAAIAAGALAPVALAASEPKNEQPFTRPVTGAATSEVRQPARVMQVTYGEAKNQSPFTRLVADCATSSLRQPESFTRAGSGESKNELPFTRAAALRPTIAIRPSIPQDVRDHQLIKHLVTLYGNPWADGTSSGFHWRDYAIGIGTGIGLILFLAGCLMVTPLLRRQRVQAA